MMNSREDVKITFCAPDDLDEMVLAEQEKNPKFIDQDIQAYIGKLKRHASFVAACNDTSCQGFVAYYCNNYESLCAFITLVLIVPEFRGRKIAHLMIKEVLNKIESRGFKECRLEVFKDNLPAINLYVKLGFRAEKCDGNVVSMAYVF